MHKHEEKERERRMKWHAIQWEICFLIEVKPNFPVWIYDSIVVRIWPLPKIVTRISRTRSVSGMQQTRYTSWLTSISRREPGIRPELTFNAEGESLGSCPEFTD